MPYTYGAEVRGARTDLEPAEKEMRISHLGIAALLIGAVGFINSPAADAG
jgi:hypothetical protein